MKEPRWVPRLVVDSVLFDQLREHGGLPGIRDESGLEAALARPKHKWHYEPDADLATLAAAYAFALTSAHPFNDGNKRIAFLTTAVFLGLNGKELIASEVDVVQTMVALASGALTETDLAVWIRQNTARLKL
jgi:death on curing protein